MAWFLVVPCLLLLCHESSSRRAFQAHANSLSYTPLNLHPHLCCLHELTFTPSLKPMGMKPCHWLPQRRKNGQVWQRSESDAVESLSSLKSRFFGVFYFVWLSCCEKSKTPCATFYWREKAWPLMLFIFVCSSIYLSRPEGCSFSCPNGFSSQMREFEGTMSLIHWHCIQACQQRCHLSAEKTLCTMENNTWSIMFSFTVKHAVYIFI